MGERPSIYLFSLSSDRETSYISSPLTSYSVSLLTILKTVDLDASTSPESCVFMSSKCRLHHKAADET
ncbi:unnamed protein product [Litomosoides sigmodontis]|uniref:Uncharacterized protein n=1 Tax=Litomosoides sigmodontis TaxID=42156 RepID=A0A3P6SRR6_LITSI|nr:unnamed protein product [Litomosoides sigmodontis]